MSSLKTQFADIGKMFVHAAATFNQHRIFFFFIIAALAVLGALLQSQQHINPSRDEQYYSEGVTGIQYKTIDPAVIEQLRLTQEEIDIEVSPSLVPHRSNPFAE